MKNTILITGATGYIGSVLVKKILQENKRSEKMNEIDKLVLIVRNKKRAIALLKKELHDTKMELYFIESSLENIEPKKIYMPIDYIIHCAAPTQSAYMVSHPVETTDSIVLGSRNMLELARFFGVKSMVYLSSMEVYGVVSDIGRPRKEDELGDISLSSARSCYSFGKRMAEHYCHIYQQEYGIPVKIARLAQTFGTGVRQDDNRVYMQFARAAYERKDIVLKTQGRSMGNYCASEDTISAIFTIMEKGKDGEVYNVVNEKNTMLIWEMAQLVAKEIAKGKICVKIETEDASKTGYAPDTELRLSSEKLRSLGWTPTKDLIQMYQDLIKEIYE